MLNFKCVYNSKNVTVSFDATLSQNYYAHGLSAKECIGVTNTLMEVARSQSKNNIYKQDLKDIVKDIDLVIRLKSLVRRYRSHHLSPRSMGDKVDMLIGEINSLFFSSTYEDFVKSLNINHRLVIHEASTGLIGTDPSYLGLSKLYNPITNNRKKLDKTINEITSFNYSNYLDDGDAKSLVKSINKSVDVINDKIRVYESIVKEAGDDLINWTTHKISRRVNTLNETGISSWSISSWIHTYCKHLKSKGVKVEVVKKKKSKIDRIKEKDIETLTQDELVCLFKNSDSSTVDSAVNFMSYETLFSLLDSNLKTVQNLIFGRYTRKRLQGIGNRMFYLVQKNFPKNKKEFDRILNYSQKYSCSLDKDFILENHEFLDKSQKFVLHNVNFDTVTKEMFDLFLKDESPKDIVSIQDSVTYEYVSRLSDEGRIEILPRLCGEYLKQSEKSSIDFILKQSEFDDIQNCYFNKLMLFDLYGHIEWSVIREDILKTGKNSVPFIMKNKDIDAAIEYIKKANNWNSEPIEELSELLDQDQLLECLKENDIVFNKVRDHIENDTLLKYWEYSIDVENPTANLEDIADLCDERGILNDLKKAIYKLPRLTTIVFGYGSSNLEKLFEGDNALKLEFIAKGNIDDSDRQASSYRARNYYVNPKTRDFFKSLSRKEIFLTLEGDVKSNILNYGSIRKYLIYITHIMTQEELIEASDMHNEFLRAHLDKLPYSYLKKFKDKNAFKEAVGDRRNRANNNFAYSLESKLKDDLKERLNPANTIKLIHD